MPAPRSAAAPRPIEGRRSSRLPRADDLDAAILEVARVAGRDRQRARAGDRRDQPVEARQGAAEAFARDGEIAVHRGGRRIKFEDPAGKAGGDEIVEARLEVGATPPQPEARQSAADL